jgi:lipopolysaccharide/colanic/teichoic acid biosynthesis glycosyltransferase
LGRKTHAGRLVAKRVFDVGVGVLLALVALPVIIVCALGSAIALRSWPFFVQPRVGYRGREFRFIKIRSLPRTTPVATDKYSLDGLVTNRFEKLFRRTHLDELPQLLLVPIGRMSLVGPRPEMPELLERYPTEFARQRVLVRPGCTGLWQISADLSKMIYEVPEYDEHYVNNWSMRLDLWILWRTATSLLGRRPMTMRDIPAWAAGSPREGAPRSERHRSVDSELRKVSNGS